MAAMEPMTRTITTDKTPEEARAALTAALQQLGASPTEGPEGSLEAQTGKKVGTRLVGAMFVPDEWLPLHHSVAIVPGDGPTTVELTVQDDLGMGIRSGFKAKYEILMKRRLGELANAVG